MGYNGTKAINPLLYKKLSWDPVKSFEPLSMVAREIANASVNDLSGVWQHAQLRARGRWVEVDTEAGPVPALLPPAAASPDDARLGAVPALGQHTDALLAELGYSDAEVAPLRSARAI